MNIIKQYILILNIAEVYNVPTYCLISPNIITDSVVTLNLKSYLDNCNYDISIEEIKTYIEDNNNYWNDILYKTDRNFILAYLSVFYHYGTFPEYIIKGEDKIFMKRRKKGVTFSFLLSLYRFLFYKKTISKVEFSGNCFNSVSIEQETKYSIAKEGQPITCKEIVPDYYYLKEVK